MAEKININFDPPEKISELYGIGTKLAKKIVEYRDQKGFFHKPEDLADVDGLALNLALTLAPHINWQLPTESLALPLEEFTTRLSMLVDLIALMILFLGVIPPLYVIAPSSKAFGGSEIIEIVGMFAIISAFGSYTQLRMTRNKTSTFSDQQKSLKILRILSIIVISYIVLMASIRVIPKYFPIAFWAIFDPNHNFFTNTISVLLFVSIVVFIYFPLLAVLYKPRNIRSWLITGMNFSIFPIAIISFYLVWTTKQKLPLSELALTGLYGAFLIFIGLLGLKQYYFHFNFLFLLYYFPNVKQDKWISWVNLHVPNPEDQVALKLSLEKMHPGSRFQKIRNFIIIGIGGWFIYTSIEAIVQLLVQDWFKELIDTLR